MAVGHQQATALRRPGPTAPSRWQGLTLVELMVAIAVALILLAGVLQLFVSNKKAYRVQEGASLLNENFRYAISQLEYSIRMAGHWGGAKESAIDVRGNVAPKADCNESPAFRNIGSNELEIGFGLEGFDGAQSSPLACVPNNQYLPDTDILVVRYASAERECIAPSRKDESACMASNPDFAEQRMLRASASYGADLFLGKDFQRLYGPNGTAASADIMPGDESADREMVGNYKAHFEVYFVRRCDVPADLDDPSLAGLCPGKATDTPTLSRLVLRGNTLELENLVSGVEQFQVTYGVDDDSDRAPNRFLNASEVRLLRQGRPGWSAVTSTRVSLVLRNNEKDMTHRETVIYRLYGGKDGNAFAYKPEDLESVRFHRRAFASSVQSRNTLRNIR